MIFGFFYLNVIALKSHVQVCEMHWKMASSSIFLSFWVCLVTLNVLAQIEKIGPLKDTIGISTHLKVNTTLTGCADT
jgi:hypothetical protein